MAILILVEMIRYADYYIETYEKRTRVSTPIREFDICIELIRIIKKYEPIED